MSARVICLASAKGGSGKTVLTATFAAFLAEIGKRILMIDCDESTNGLTLLYLDKVNDYRISQPTICGMFEAKSASQISSLQVSDNLYMIPATFRFKPTDPAGEQEFYDMILRLISQERENYDYIFLDAQAGLDQISQVVMKSDISDEVIIVSEYDPLSAAGVERLKFVMGEHLNFSRTWILLNKMLPEFVKSFSEFLSVARYLPPMAWTADVVRAYSKRKLPINFETGNDYTLAILQTLRGLLPQTDVAELDAWAENRAAVLRQPIEDQLSDLEVKYEYLLNEKNRLRRMTMFRRIVMLSAVIAIVVGIMMIGIFVFFGVISGEKLPGQEIEISTLSGVAVGVALIGALIAIAAMIIPFFDRASIEEKRLDIDLKNTEESLGKFSALRDADFERIIGSITKRPK